LVEIIAMASKFIRHTSLVICIAVVYEQLKVLYVMMQAIQLELDVFQRSISMFQVQEFKVDIIV